jgi:signal transduction histidine kinase
MSVEEQISAQDAIQLLQDIEHSLRTLIAQARFRIEATIEKHDPPQAMRRELLMARSICARASQVLKRIDVFESLHRDKPLYLCPVLLTGYDLSLMLERIIEDSAALVAERDEKRISIDADSFEFINARGILVDPDLLEQSIREVIDNAVKYSFAKTTIMIDGSILHGGAFQLRFKSVGLALQGEEVSQSLLRGWRGSSAVLCTGGGSGLGLWIADNLMRAHKGRVVVSPTTSQGVTEISLILPTI